MGWVVEVRGVEGPVEMEMVGVVGVGLEEED